MRKISHFLFFSALVFASVSAADCAYAAVPEPQTGGKFFENKGTKAADDIDASGLAHRPIFEYGKGLQFGAVHVTPSIDYNYIWDNNVFLEENGRRSDYYHQISPAMTAELPLNGGQHVVNAFASGEIERFDRFDFADHEDFTIGAGAQLNFVPFFLAIDETFTNTTERGDTEFSDRVDRDENTMHALLEVPLASFFLESEGFLYDIEYSQDANITFDHEDIIFYQRAGIDLSPRTQLLVEYGYTDIEYTKVENRDGDANQGMVGFRGQLTELIAYQAWVGYQARVYDLDSAPDYYGAIARGSLVWNMSATSALTLRADRTPQESTFDNQSFYVRNRLEAALKKQIAERIYLNAREVFSYNEYSRNTSTAFAGSDGGHTRRDSTWDTGLGLEYRFPNELVSIIGEYRLRSRQSNTGGLSYDGQSVNLGVKATF